jgi:hypothetical protein
MEEAQTIRKKRLTVSITTARRQNLLEKKIPPLYSAEEKGNQNTTRYQKCANPVYRALYSQAVKLKRTFFIY